MKKIFWTLGTLIGVYLIARALSWPFTTDLADPASYAADWGGPTLLGVAAVHTGPGILAAVAFAALIVRSRRRYQSRTISSPKS